jgi:hypothetical protein
MSTDMYICTELFAHNFQATLTILDTETWYNCKVSLAVCHWVLALSVFLHLTWTGCVNLHQFHYYWMTDYQRVC